MDNWWSFWSRQEWYWSALSFLCIFLIVLLMVCLCWKFCNAIKDPYDDDDHFIIPRDPAPSLIILHAQTPSESERILRHYDSITHLHQHQQQQQYQSTAPRCQPPCHYNSQFSAQPYDHQGLSHQPQGPIDSRPPPYAPNYYK